jgi:biotin transport system substrate-specific component
MNERSSAVAISPGSTARMHVSSGLLATARGKTVAILLGSVFIALCAQLAVPLPWTPVPMTMQPFGVLLVGLLLGPWLGAAAMAAYLLEGVAGLPVFVPGFGGLLPLGPSAGYLLSYPLVAMLVGVLSGSSRGFLRSVTAAAMGDACILLCGAGWLAFLTHGTLSSVFHLAVLPFVAGDAVKVLLAAAIASGWTRFHPVHSPAGV